MKAGSWKKRLLRGLVILVCLYFVWLGAILLFYRARRVAPREISPNEVQGVYHIHTAFSDGYRSLQKIAATASRQHLDFLILADHGNPNQASLASQGWHGDVLVLAGSELSVSRGHLVALDFRPPAGMFAQNAEAAAEQVAAGGGFTVIAHPFSKTRWSWGNSAGYAGIEIINGDSMVKRNLARSIPYLPAFPISPRIFLLKTLMRPQQSLRKWDELGRSRPVYGYFAADAHLAYGALFPCFRLHVLLEGPLAREFDKARAQVFGSLRRGAFYCAIDAAEPASGFDFWAERGGSRYAMGSSVRSEPSSRVEFRAKAAFPFAVEACLFRDGVAILRSEEPEISFPVEGPGVYRIEVYLKGRSPLARDFPWITSNPIYVREDGT